MNAKKISLVLAAALLISAAPFAAQASEQTAGAWGARPFHGDVMKCPKPQLSAEQKAALDELSKEHRAEMGQLREKLVWKRMELKALSPNPNVKPEELKALVAEIIGIKKQIRTKNSDFIKKMREAGFPAPFIKHSSKAPHGMKDFHGRMHRNDGCQGYGFPSCPSDAGCAPCERPRCERSR